MTITLKSADAECLHNLTQMALRGERCPFNDKLPTGILPRLARQGKIRIEVYRRNWRVVTILSGPHTGANTKKAPFLPAHAKPYVVIDGSSGSRRSDLPAESRREPWKPGTPR